MRGQLPPAGKNTIAASTAQSVPVRRTRRERNVAKELLHVVGWQRRPRDLDNSSRCAEAAQHCNPSTSAVLPAAGEHAATHR